MRMKLAESEESMISGCSVYGNEKLALLSLELKMGPYLMC